MYALIDSEAYSLTCFSSSPSDFRFPDRYQQRFVDRSAIALRANAPLVLYSYVETTQGWTLSKVRAARKSLLTFPDHDQAGRLARMTMRAWRRTDGACFHASYIYIRIRRLAKRRTDISAKCIRPPRPVRGNTIIIKRPHICKCYFIQEHVGERS